MDEIPKELKELLEKLGGQMIQVNDDSKTGLLSELHKLKSANRAAKEAMLALVVKLGGSATVSSQEANDAIENYTLEYRTDSADDNVYFYAKVKDDK